MELSELSHTLASSIACRRNPRFLNILLDTRALRIGALILAAISFIISVPVHASEICAEVSVQNNTDVVVNTSANLGGGAWAADPLGWNVPGYSTNPDGSPPSSIHPGATILFRSCSNGGILPTGTGGSLTLTNLGPGFTATWSAPWGAANGNIANCSQSSTKPSGFAGYKLNSGYGTEGGSPLTCIFPFQLATNTATPMIAVKRSFGLSNSSGGPTDTVLALHSDNTLWLNQTQSGTSGPRTAQVDATVRSFQGIDDSTVMILGTDARLWEAKAPFGQVPPPGRQAVDEAVYDFQALDSQTVVARDINASLWLETGPFGSGSPARQQIDANVKAFNAANSHYILVMGFDNKLWLEQAPFGNVPPSRVLVDDNAIAFQPSPVFPTALVFVLRSDGNLWLENAPFGTAPPPRQQIDANVQAFQAIDPNTVVVLGVNGNLWIEHAPFSTANVPPARQQIDANVKAFFAIDSNNLLVQGTDNSLWLEHAPFGTALPPARTLVDQNVL